MAFKVNDIEYYHPQTSSLSCQKVAIIFFLLGGVNDIFYGHSPTEWHDNPSTQRQLSVSSLGEVGEVFNGCSPTKSFPASSSMVASWQPITFLPLVGPGRTAAIWGFLKATLPTEAVTMSLRITPVASKFSLLIKAVTTNMYCLSPSAWSDGVRGPASSTNDLVVGAT